MKMERWAVGNLCITTDIKKTLILANKSFDNFWCPRWDLNPHTFRHTHLKRTCLPFHHPGTQTQFARYTDRRQRHRILQCFWDKNISSVFVWLFVFVPLCETGAPSRVRTYNQRLRRPLLFQLSYGCVLSLSECLRIIARRWENANFFRAFRVNGIKYRLLLTFLFHLLRNYIFELTIWSTGWKVCATIGRNINGRSIIIIVIPCPCLVLTDIPWWSIWTPMIKPKTGIMRRTIHQSGFCAIRRSKNVFTKGSQAIQAYEMWSLFAIIWRG